MAKRIRPHWTQSYKLRTKELEAEIEAMHEMEHVRVFAKELAENIGITLANMPLSRWPDIAKQAFDHAALRMETSAYLYKQRLPKE